MPEADADLIERAVALAREQSPEEAAAFLKPHGDAHAADYNFHFEAGKALQDAEAPHLALPFLAKALSLKRTASVVERLFVCNVGLGRNREAVQMLMAALEVGYRTALRRDFAAALRKAAPGELDGAWLSTLTAKFASDILMGPGLLPHLIAAGRAGDVETIAGNGAIDPRNWDEDMVLETAAYLERQGKHELSLRVLCRCGGETEPFVARLRAALDRYPPARLKEAVLPILAIPEGRFNIVVHAEPYLEIAERFVRHGDAGSAIETLTRLNAAIDPTTDIDFARRYSRLISPLIASLVTGALNRDDVLDRALAMMPLCLEPDARAFFLHGGIDNLIANLGAPPISAAPSGSRRAILRDGYFRHHLERREGETLPAATGTFELCHLAYRYFRLLSRQIPADSVPFSREFVEPLVKPVLTIDKARSIGALMAYASMQSASGLHADLGHDAQAAIDGIAWRYAGAVVPDCGIPSTLIPDWIVTDLNAVLPRAPAGVNMTKFMHAAWQASEIYRQKYDLDAPLDPLLLFLDLLGARLSRNPQLRPFLAAMVPAKGKDHDLLQRSLQALIGARTSDFLAALSGRPAAARPATVSATDTQHVLLVGHASKGTGLGRNFQMLHEALKANVGEGIFTETLDFEAKGFDVTARLAAWRRGFTSRPIVIYAVNAEDVPWAMLKDAGGAFSDGYGVGFFLWEMSRAPEVQQLGIKLVDEVWAPSRYVADIYAPLAPTHMIGKGLYDAAVAQVRRAPAKPFRLLTVFDFDSSIERKNPLAVVQAFQTAFGPGEEVELVVKGSGVKPEHWSNALGQWERLNAAVAGDRRIRLITARLTDAEMDDLFRSAGCMVSLHRGEGFGYAIADAMAMGMPVIATDYSGNADYCTAETAFPVAYKPIGVDRRVMQWDVKGAEWADADIESAAAQMRAVFECRDEALRVAARGRETVLRKYSKDAFRRTVLARIDDIRSKL